MASQRLSREFVCAGSPDFLCAPVSCSCHDLSHARVDALTQAPPPATGRLAGLTAPRFTPATAPNEPPLCRNRNRSEHEPPEQVVSSNGEYPWRLPHPPGTLTSSTTPPPTATSARCCDLRGQTSSDPDKATLDRTPFRRPQVRLHASLQPGVVGTSSSC